MKATKVIRGTPIYIYHGTQYLDKPDNLVYAKMKYDEVENITYVYLKRKKYIVELLCTIIISICVYLTLTGRTEQIIDANYNNLIVYYNDNLYVNWSNPIYNKYEVSFKLYDGSTHVLSRTLQPGETLTTTRLDECVDRYSLVISAIVYGKDVSTTVTVNVMNKEDY